MISEKETGYGTAFLEQVSKDLKDEFPEMKGLSYRNLALCRQFYQFYTHFSNLQQPVADLPKAESIIQQPVKQISQQLVARTPWGHNILIFRKSKKINEAYFYIAQTIGNGWSRDVLALQIKSKMYQRQGMAIYH